MKKIIQKLILIPMLLVFLGSFAQETRTEHDLLGDVKIPVDAYYGAQAARGMENFQISGQYINDYPEYIKAWGMIKLAAARANTDVGEMDKEKLKLCESI